MQNSHKPQLKTRTFVRVLTRPNFGADGDYPTTSGIICTFQAAK